MLADVYIDADSGVWLRGTVDSAYTLLPADEDGIVAHRGLISHQALDESERAHARARRIDGVEMVDARGTGYRREAGELVPVRLGIVA